MATKVTGIKGINISKSSVLNDGSKKTGTNESFRDTLNGTTRDNSGNNALDAATLKMLLGQTELMAKKTKEIELNMEIARQQEKDRQQKIEEEIKNKERREREREEKNRETKFDSYYNKVDKGIINAGLATLVGPAGVLLGKGLNAMGVPLERWGKKLLLKGRSSTSNNGLGHVWGTKNKDEHSDTNALSVNRREEAAAPVNNLKIAVVKRLDKIINLLGGRKTGNEEENKKGLLKGLFDNVVKPALSGLGGALFGRLLPWLGKKLLFLSGIGAIGYGLHKLWGWAKDKFGPNWANGIVLGSTRALKSALQGVGEGIQKAANSLKVFKQSAGSARAIGNTSKALGKIANSGKIGNWLLGGAAKRSRAASIAAQKALQAGELNKVGKAVLGTSKAVSKLGRAAGVVGNLIIAGEAGYDAYNKFQAGDNRGGYGSIGRGIGSIAGGWGGALAGAAIGQTLIPIPFVGAAIGGILGAIGGGYLGSKGGEALGEYGYDLATRRSENQAESEGSLTTENPVYSSLKLQNEGLEIQKEMLNALRNLEYNLNPQIQKDLDDAYINNISREFNKAPTATESNYFNDYLTLSSTWKDTLLNKAKNG